jgi:hypothetical protein
MISFAIVSHDGTLITLDERTEGRTSEPIGPGARERVQETVCPGPDTGRGHAAFKANLPSPNIGRWTPRRKAAVVMAVLDGRLLREEACRCYQLTAEELLAWEDAFKTSGTRGMHAVRVARYRLTK